MRAEYDEATLFWRNANTEVRSMFHFALGVTLMHVADEVNTRKPEPSWRLE